MERRKESPVTSGGQILWLVAAILVAGTPHFLHVHPWVPIAVTLVLAWRVIAALRRRPLPGSFIRVTLTLLAFIGVLFSYRKLSGLDAGSALMLIMAALKLLETRGHRDRAVVIFICYFLLFATFLREQAIWSGVYLVICILVTTTALLQTARKGPALPAPMAMAYATRLILQSLPIALLLFLLFPRIPGPFWSLPATSSSAVTGLSDELSPGDISELALSDRVAFRVRFETDPPAAAELYWRGPVLDNFDGRRWVQRRADPRGFAPPKDANGPLIDYELTLEPHNQRWLLALETPSRWDARGASFSASGQLLRDIPVTQRMSYRGTSLLSDTRTRAEPPVVLQWSSALPGDSNPRSRELAREIRAAATSERDYLNRLMRYFVDQPFYYTLRPPKLGDNTVDEFLFDTRRGFCGHYASAFALLARAGGVPARVVTGYQGAEQNPLGNYWIIRQSDAHAWTEAWIDGRWVRFDPTAMVAPDRIEFGFEEAMERRDELSAGRLTASQLFERIAMSWDALNTSWNRWVLSFGPESQSSLLSLAGIRNPGLIDLVVVMAVSITLALIVTGLIQRYRSRPRPDPLSIAYNELCGKLGKLVRSRKPAEGPNEYLAVIDRQRPELADQLKELFAQYVRLRYDTEADADAVDRFRTAVRAFSPKLRAETG